MAKLKKWVRAKLKLSKKPRSDANGGSTLDTNVIVGKAEEVEEALHVTTSVVGNAAYEESESTVARPAETQASSSDAVVPPPKKSRIIRSPEEIWTDRLLSDHNGSPQKALLWATQHEQRRAIALLLHHGIHDAKPKSFRRCLNFALRRDESALLMQFLPTIRDKELLPAILEDVPFLKLFVKDADPMVAASYLDCLNAQCRRDMMLAAIERGELAFLARALPMIREDGLRSSILQDADFMILVGSHLTGDTVAFQTLMQGLKEEDREWMVARLREGAPFSSQCPRGTLLSAIQRGDVALLAKVLPILEDDSLRSSILQNTEFLILVFNSITFQVVEVQMLCQSLNEGERARMVAQFRAGVSTGEGSQRWTYRADFDPSTEHWLWGPIPEGARLRQDSHVDQILESMLDKASDAMEESGAKKRGPWPERVDTDPKTKEKVRVTPMEPYYWN